MGNYYDFKTIGSVTTISTQDRIEGTGRAKAAFEKLKGNKFDIKTNETIVEIAKNIWTRYDEKRGFWGRLLNSLIGCIFETSQNEVWKLYQEVLVAHKGEPIKEKVVDKKQEKSPEKPEVKPEEKPVDTVIVKTQDKTVEKPVVKPEGKPVDKVMVKTQEKSPEKPLIGSAEMTRLLKFSILSGYVQVLFQAMDESIFWILFRKSVEKGQDWETTYEILCKDTKKKLEEIKASYNELTAESDIEPFAKVGLEALQNIEKEYFQRGLIHGQTDTLEYKSAVTDDFVSCLNSLRNMKHESLLDGTFMSLMTPKIVKQFNDIKSKIVFTSGIGEIQMLHSVFFQILNGNTEDKAIETFTKDFMKKGYWPFEIPKYFFKALVEEVLQNDKKILIKAREKSKDPLIVECIKSIETICGKSIDELVKIIEEGKFKELLPTQLANAYEKKLTQAFIEDQSKDKDQVAPTQ